MDDSLLGNGSDSDIYGTQATFEFSTNLFTIEGFFLTTSLAARQTIFAKRFGDLGDGPALYIETTGALTFEASGGTVATGGSVSINTWYHVAIVRDSANAGKLYFDGNKIGADGTVNSDFVGDYLHIMSNGDGGSYLAGSVAAIRVTTGVARYTGATYAIPTLPLPTS